MIYRKMRDFARNSVVLLLKKGFVSPVAELILRDIAVPDQNRSDLITILVLNSGRFRGDLEILTDTGKFRIITAPFHWQCRLYDWFYEAGDNCFEAHKNSEIYSRQKEYRKFLARLLPKLFEKLGVDLVIGAAIHYKQDLDWGAASHECGVPYLVMHREGNVSSRYYQELTYNNGKKYKRFQGTALILHNDVQRQQFIRSAFIDADACFVAGIPRMDDLAKKALTHRSGSRTDKSGRRKHVTFFSFGPGTGIPQGRPPLWPKDMENYLYKLAKFSHIAMIEFARDNPDIDVMIKPKWRGSWLNHIKTIVSPEASYYKQLDNLSIDPEANVHDLLEKTDVVISFGSTTLLEAAIMGLPVIMPYFAEAREEKWQDYILYGDDLKCFDLANSPAELTALIHQQLETPKVSAEMQKVRDATFEKYISSLDSTATQRLEDILMKYASKSNSKGTS